MHRSRPHAVATVGVQEKQTTGRIIKGYPGYKEIRAAQSSSHLSVSSGSTGEKKQGGSILAGMVSNQQFKKDLHILMITSIYRRIICHFIDQIEEAKLGEISRFYNVFMGFLHAEQIINFMQSMGFKFVEEIDFDPNGDLTPVVKEMFFYKENPIIFTTCGFLFFEYNDGSQKRENIVIRVYHDKGNRQVNICIYSRERELSAKFIENLSEFTKKNSSLHGCKMRDLRIDIAEYTEIIPTQKDSWDRYYCSPDIKKICDTEVFGLVNNVDKYREAGIERRGILFHGDPGTGKTTLGRIICAGSGDATVLWITPDLIGENNVGAYSVKLLYEIANFLSPSIVICEDMDLWTNDRDDMNDTLRLGALMNILDGVNSTFGTVSIAMTNRLELMEKALKNRPGRYDRIIHIPVLDTELRTQMFVDEARSQFIIDDESFSYLVKNTDGWTGATVKEFIKGANMKFIMQDIPTTPQRHLTLDMIQDILTTMMQFTLNHATRKKAGF